MLPFLMFSSTDSLTSWPMPSVSLTSIATISSVPQTLPTFSTASKHPTCRNGCNSIRFMLLLHNFWIPRGRGSRKQAKHFFSLPFWFQLYSSPTIPLTPFDATLTKNAGGWGPLLSTPPRRTAFTPTMSGRLCVILFLFLLPLPLPTRPIAWSHLRYLVTSLLLYLASQLSSRPNSMKRTSLLRRHTTGKQYPVTAPFRIK